MYVFPYILIGYLVKTPYNIIEYNSPQAQSNVREVQEAVDFAASTPGKVKEHFDARYLASWDAESRFVVHNVTGDKVGELFWRSAAAGSKSAFTAMAMWDTLFSLNPDLPPYVPGYEQYMNNPHDVRAREPSLRLQLRISMGEPEDACATHAMVQTPRSEYSHNAPPVNKIWENLVMFMAAAHPHTPSSMFEEEGEEGCKRQRA